MHCNGCGVGEESRSVVNDDSLIMLCVLGSRSTDSGKITCFMAKAKWFGVMVRHMMANGSAI